MITARTFTKEWLLEVNKSLGWNRQETQLKNLEKAIAAFHLLESLANERLEFIFKGGTSLLLLLQKIYRLSVDIDIIVEEPIDDVNETFSSVCAKSRIFTRFEQQERGNDALTLVKHYKFFYLPFADETEESYIFLDLYNASNPYANTLEMELKSDIIDTDNEILTVRMPDVDSILGDKLTAFAPNTIGISLSAEPGYRPKRVEVLKQLYDISNLFVRAENVYNIRQTYNTVAAHEIEKRGLTIYPEDVLRDSMHHAFIIGHGGKVDKPLYDSIAKGYKDFNKFVADLSFDDRQAVLAAAKTAYLTTILLTGDLVLRKYSRDIDMSAWKIESREFLDYNEYKYSNPEAFYYWCEALNNL